MQRNARNERKNEGARGRNARCKRREVNGEKGLGRELRKRRKKKSERIEKGKGVSGWSVSVSQSCSLSDTHRQCQGANANLGARYHVPRVRACSHLLFFLFPGCTETFILPPRPTP